MYIADFITMRRQALPPFTLLDDGLQVVASGGGVDAVLLGAGPRKVAIMLEVLTDELTVSQ